jgi:hypothetical protein
VSTLQGHPAHQQPVDALAAVRGHDDQVALVLLCGLDDGVRDHFRLCDDGLSLLHAPCLGSRLGLIGRLLSRGIDLPIQPVRIRLFEQDRSLEAVLRMAANHPDDDQFGRHRKCQVGCAGHRRVCLFLLALVPG